MSEASHGVQIEDGVLYTYAKNANGNRFGQLGVGRTERTVEQIGHKYAVDLPAKAVSAAAGGNQESGHTLCATEDGSLYTFGCDRWQQLGLGSTENGSVGYTWEGGRLWRNEPQKVNALSHYTIIEVACGTEHSMALSNNGDVFCFGRGNKGQLESGKKPFVGAPSRSAALSATQTEVPIAISAIADCSCAWLIPRWQYLNINRMQTAETPSTVHEPSKIEGRLVCIGAACSRFMTQMETMLRKKEEQFFK